MAMEQPFLTPTNALAFIFTGEFDDSNLEFDPGQTERMEQLMDMMAKNRLWAVQEIPPLEGPPSPPKLNPGTDPFPGDPFPSPGGTGFNSGLN